MKQVLDICFMTDWERINAYESETIWVATITYNDGTKLRLNHTERNELVDMVKDKLI